MCGKELLVKGDLIDKAARLVDMRPAGTAETQGLQLGTAEFDDGVKIRLTACTDGKCTWCEAVWLCRDGKEIGRMGRSVDAIEGEWKFSKCTKYRFTVKRV